MRTSLTEIALLVCLCIFLPDDDFVEVETYRRNKSDIYLFLIYNLLDQILYINFLIFRSYFLTTYSGRIRFAEVTSLFYSTCYAH